MGDYRIELKQKKERLGEIRKNREGYEMKIVEYNNCHDIIVEFQDKYKAKVHTGYGNFKKGVAKNPYHPSVFGIGYVGTGKYKPSINGKDTKAYRYWKHMLQRCYDPYYLDSHPTYRDCVVCNEWHNLQNFAEWFYKNYYEVEGCRMCLDKDILVKKNKIYSPKTCIFAPNRINILFVKRQNDRGYYPIGVSYNTHKNKLYVCCNTLDGLKHLGLFPLDKPFQAFTCYKNFKENYIKQVSDEYKDLIPQKLYETLYKYEVEIND